MSEPRTCVGCGSTFTSQNRAVYCGRECRANTNGRKAAARRVHLKESAGVVCCICGKPVPQKPGPGRPAIYCGSACRDLSHLLIRVGAHVARVSRGATPEARSYLRACLWQIGNSTNGAGPVLRIRETVDKKRTGWRGLDPAR